MWGKGEREGETLREERKHTNDSVWVYPLKQRAVWVH